MLNAKCKIAVATTSPTNLKPLSAEQKLKGGKFHQSSNKRQVTSKLVVTCLILCLPLALRGRCHAVTDEDYNLQISLFHPNSLCGRGLFISRNFPATTILHFALCILHSLSPRDRNFALCTLHFAFY